MRGLELRTLDVGRPLSAAPTTASWLRASARALAEAAVAAVLIQQSEHKIDALTRAAEETVWAPGVSHDNGLPADDELRWGSGRSAVSSVQLKCAALGLREWRQDAKDSGAAHITWAIGAAPRLLHRRTDVGDAIRRGWPSEESHCRAGVAALSCNGWHAVATWAAPMR